MDESITVERVRHALVVGRLDADGAAVLLAANLPRRREKTFVVVGASSVAAMARLDPWVTADLADEVRGDLCVVAPGFGSMGSDGALPPARLLADRLGVEVTAADGEPVGLADGSVFVPGQTAGWVAYRPGGQRVPVGARLPAPWWQDGLPEPADHITHVPAGLWVRRPGMPARPDDPLLRRVPDLDRMYVVLGAPGELPPTATTVTEVLRSLPDEGRDRAVLAWYGSGALADAMARGIADELDAPVRVAHGVPGDGGLVYVDASGAARWRPFAVESVYRPGRAPVLDRWIAPAALATAEPGSFRLADGWRVDVVPRGLVVRPESVAPGPALLSAVAAGTGPTADLVVAADGPLPDDVRTGLDDLVRELPADTRAALRVLPVDEAAAEAIIGIEAADRIVYAPPEAPAVEPAQDAEVAPPTGAVVVTSDGRILPAAPILAIPAPPEIERSEGTGFVQSPNVEIQDGVLVVALDDDETGDETEPTFDATGTGEDEEQAAAIPSVAAATIAPPSATAPAAPLSAPAAASTGTPTEAPATAAQERLPLHQAAPPQPRTPAEAGTASIAGLLPTREPRAVVRPVAAPVSTPIEVPENVRSTAAQRRAMRAKLGARYDVATRAVTKLLSERPGLRFGTGDRAALLAELAVVRVFADDPAGQYDADFYVCLADGLRRLPTARTVVVRGIPADTKVEPEAVLRLPTPVVAAPATAHDAVGPAEALIWTTTARRLDGLLDDPVPAQDEEEVAPPRAADVVLSGHTRLRVLAVESEPVRRILLAEDGTAPEAALTRLRAAAAARPATARAPGGSRWFGPLPAAG